jgi:hypothetical protein
MAKVPKFTPYSRNINNAYNNSSGRYRQSLANKLMDVYADTKDLDKMLAANIASVQARKLERKMQDELWKKQNYASRIVDETKLQNIDMGGSADNDAIRNLVRDMQEKVYQAKKWGREHPEFQHEVPRVIAEQQAAIQRMMGVATNVSVALDGYDKAMKIPPGQAGAVSVMTPDASQRVMLGIRDGSTSFVTKNGKLFGIRPNENGQPDVVNLDELSADIEKGNNFFQTVPDLTESLKGSYNNVFKPGGKDNADLITFEEKRVGSQVATVKFMTPEQREQGIKSLVNGNQFKGILDDESRMKVIWSDMMGKDVPWQQVEGDTREEVEANLAKQRNEAAYFLAQKAVEDNAAPDGIKMVEGRSKYQPKGSGNKSQKPTEIAKNMIAQQARIDSMEYLGKDPNEIAKYLTDLNRGDSFYEVVDDAYIDGLVDEEKESEYIKKNAKSDSEEDLQKAKEEYRTKFLKNYKKGDIVDKNGNVIDVSTQKALERAILDEEGYSKAEQIVYRSNASDAAKKAYEELKESERPTEDEKFFKYKGRKYLNPIYVPASERPITQNQDLPPIDFAKEREEKIKQEKEAKENKSNRMIEDDSKPISPTLTSK